MVALIDSELDHNISSTTGSLARLLPVEDTLLVGSRIIKSTISFNRDSHSRMSTTKKYSTRKSPILHWRAAAFDVVVGVKCMLTVLYPPVIDATGGEVGSLRQYR
jgi:hypothetical protein